MVNSKPALITIVLGLVVVAIFGFYTFAADVWVFENVLMLVGLYVLLSPRIHEFLTEKLV